MQRSIKIAVGVYICFACLIYLYLFHFADTSIPGAYQGTEADPSIFMNEQELLLSGEFSKVRNLLFFLETPFEWLFYFVILIVGLSRKMESSVSIITSSTFLQRILYLFYLSILSFVASFPFNYWGYSLATKYNINTQSFDLWMKDELISFWINFFITAIIVLTLFALISKSTKRWWLYLWLASVPFSLFFMFIKPVIIDPIYNDFYPLKNKVLEEKILMLADQAGIPSEHVFEVNMADKTNAMNAYVSGIGSNSRIVLWDTTLNKLDEEEILFIMAHEMAHYVEKHIYIGIAIYIITSFIGLYLVARIMNYIVKRWGGVLHIVNLKSNSSLPLFLCIVSMLTFASDPIMNSISRYQEQRADQYAIELINDKEAAISSFQKLSKSSLSQLNPPWLVKIFRYTHPTMLERISTIENDEK